MNRKNRPALLLAVCCMCLLLAGCKPSADKIEFSDAASARDALNNAASIEVEGNLDAVLQSGNIRADGKVAAFLLEDGFWNSHWTVSVDGDLWFYIKYVTDEPINNIEGVNTGTTYGYYDGDDNCLGYVQQRLVDTPDGDRDYYMVFLNADGSGKGLYAARNGQTLYSEDGSVLATGSNHTNFFSNNCQVYVDMEEGCDVQVDFMDKMAMYILQFRKMSERHSS